MTTEQAELFIARLDTDTAFAERFAALDTTPEGVFALVKSEGYDVTPEEIRDVFLEKHASVLSEDQLTAIAGGLSQTAHDALMATGIVVGVSVAAGASAAAAA